MAIAALYAGFPPSTRSSRPAQLPFSLRSQTISFADPTTTWLFHQPHHYFLSVGHPLVTVDSDGGIVGEWV